MIGLRVRGHQIIQATYPCMSQERSYHTCPYINVIAIGAATVDEHSCAMWEADETGIPMADVEKGDQELTTPIWKQPGPGEPHTDHDSPADGTPACDAMAPAIRQQQESRVCQHHGRERDCPNVGCGIGKRRKEADHAVHRFDNHCCQREQNAAKRWEDLHCERCDDSTCHGD